MLDFFQSQSWQMIFQLVLAAILGGAIGFEREFRKKTAGLRTYILVCMSCTLFTLVSMNGFEEFIGTTSYDPSRITAGILTGMGFIGAGAILKRENKIEGLTTAAGLWMVSAIGIAIGLKLYLVATFVTIFTLFLLIVLRFLEKWTETKE